MQGAGRSVSGARLYFLVSPFGPLLSSGSVCRADWPVFLASRQVQRRARSIPRDAGAGSFTRLRCQRSPPGSSVGCSPRHLPWGTGPVGSQGEGSFLPAAEIMRADRAGRATRHTHLREGVHALLPSSWLSTLMGTRRPLAQALPRCHLERVTDNLYSLLPKGLCHVCQSN